MTDELRAAIYRSWTIRGPFEDPEGTGAYIIEIDELPGFVVAGETKNAAIGEFLPALATHLQSYFEAGQLIPTPHGSSGWNPREPEVPRLTLGATMTPPLVPAF